MSSLSNIIKDELNKEYAINLMNFLDQQYESTTIYPPKKALFSCFEQCNLEDIKVVIVGQDPYHQAGQAMGMAFSVSKDVAIPKSLQNIYKELVDDIGCTKPIHGDLSAWAKQGVLLLNVVMSVEDSRPGSHANHGWEQFSDHVLSSLNDYPQSLVFVLWGKYAQSKLPLLKDKRHLVLQSVHPSPLSSYRGFFGSKPFSKANQFLKHHGRVEVDWSVD